MRHRLIAAISVLLVASCSSQKSTEPPLDVKRLLADVEKLKTDVLRLQIEQTQYSSASFDPTGERAYQRIDTNLGPLLVVLDNVEPYLDGQKVTLLVGNPSNLTFSGFKMKASWSKKSPDWTSNAPREEWQKAMEETIVSTKEKELNLTDTLRPGAWNKIRFTLAPAKGDQFGHLSITISGNSVRLAGGT